MTWNVALETGGVLVSKKITPRDRGAGGAPGLIRQRTRDAPVCFGTRGVALSGGLRSRHPG